MRRSATFAALAAVLAAVPHATAARPACRPVTGHFEAHLVPPPPPGCASVVGVCTAGRVWGGLEGDYKFTMSTLVATAEPETASIFFFTGRSLVHTKDGDLNGVDTGTIDLGQGGFASLITWTGGTGDLAGTSGQIRLRGFLDNAAGTTSGDYEGSICVP